MKYLLLIILISLLTNCTEKEPIKTGLEGTPIPQFNILLPDSFTYINTTIIPSGKSIVLFDFGPSCPYSRTQMKEIIENINNLKDIQFYIFTSWPFAEMKEFYSHFALYKYSNIIVGVDFNNFFVPYFKIAGIPYIAIYGKNKLLKKAFSGLVAYKQLKNICEE